MEVLVIKRVALEEDLKAQQDRMVELQVLKAPEAQDLKAAMARCSLVVTETAEAIKLLVAHTMALEEEQATSAVLEVSPMLVLEVVVLSVLEVILDKLMATLLVERKEAAVMVAKDCY